MAEISKIKLPNKTIYDIKDAAAREQIQNIQDRVSSGMNYLGITTTPITDGATTSSVIVGDKTFNAVAGDFIIYGDLEFVFNGEMWQELGDPVGKGLGDLAYKDNATTTYTPTGTINEPIFTGTKATLIASTTPTGTISKPTFIGTQEIISSSFTPNGTVSITVGTGTANYTPAGTVAAPVITVIPTTATVNSITDVGTLPTCTLPTLEMAIEDDETLALNWTAGAFNAGTLPTKGANTTVVREIAATASAPAFTGIGADLTATFTGTAGTATATFTPEGSISTPTFTGESEDISIDYTPVGTISTPTFTGTESTITVS